MIVAAHQPVYLPGIAPLAKMAAADNWMWLGHCDYQKSSYQSRNRIRQKNCGTPMYLSVPVHAKSSHTSINEVIIVENGWRPQHLRSISQNYSKRPFFKDYFPELEIALLQPCKSLAQLNIEIVNIIRGWLGIETPTHLSQDWNIGLYPGTGTLMLAEICGKLGATEYLASTGEEAYHRPELMNGYAHSYIKFEHPVYEQGSKNFLPNLSVIDLVFNCGPQSGDIVRASWQK